jgi:hypothetical protein
MLAQNGVHSRKGMRIAGAGDATTSYVGFRCDNDSRGAMNSGLTQDLSADCHSAEEAAEQLSVAQAAT